MEKNTEFIDVLAQKPLKEKDMIPKSIKDGDAQIVIEKKNLKK